MEFDEFVYGEIFENNIVNSYSGKQATKFIVNCCSSFFVWS